MKTTFQLRRQLNGARTEILIRHARQRIPLHERRRRCRAWILSYHRTLSAVPVEAWRACRGFAPSFRDVQRGSESLYGIRQH